ncbi:palmdelphin isoform X1 [Pygocentrus nattereri]|uniref:palmdelphin isoform X1 n=1 Tax=Pygocentrus nattereri TaxID=42514 RepID=UPI001891E809|nr:palmdelphin isoform X1 [Pygocentrus nattereri]XP_017576657.2 palmdelphin isoform X1 [Pygocentrus nattereri]XP_037402342.1 palmdelphin isoform X1 [Pygocentrus nattereri]XP_037402345.1 palmdelphin isoform X1 [Pygocentrus nattereri]
MEEAELLKERLQAITDKRKIQEDIASKRLEIDREKLKLQHLKKKSMRDLWLMDGASAGNAQEAQKAQEDVQQTKLLQSNIHRIEKEIEALEREELNISTNEGLILKRLKAIEKSTEEIIKAANENFKSEPINVHPGIPDATKSYTPLNPRKQPTVNDQDTTNDQHKPALFAMEINVQKDLRTGESRVISTSTVSTQELQHKGIKVYDDGRKSVYALRSDAVQPGANGVDELSPMEVEELLRQATEKKKRPQELEDPPFNMNYIRSPSPSKPYIHQCSNGYLREPYSAEVTAWPELVYCDSSEHYPGREIHPPAHMFHHYSDEQAEYYSGNGNSYGHEPYQREMRDGHGPFYDPQDLQRGALHVDSELNHRPPSAYSNNSKVSILNALPSDEPVTMIFMGYQAADEDATSYEGSVRAELVVIGEGEEDRSAHPHLNSNANNASQRQASGQLQITEGTTGSKKTKKIKDKRKRCCMLM